MGGWGRRFEENLAINLLWPNELIHVTLDLWTFKWCFKVDLDIVKWFIFFIKEIKTLVTSVSWPYGLLALQGSHSLEKYLNLEGFLEKSLKIKSALKNTGKSLKSLEKSLNSLFSVGLSTDDRDLKLYKIVVPCAAYAAPNKGTTVYVLILY